MQMMTLDKLPPKVLSKIDLQTAFSAARCVLAAEKFQLFRKLSGKKLTAEELSRKTGIHPNRVKPYLAALMSLGLLNKKDQYYSNTSLAEKYFVKERSIHWTEVYSNECLEEYRAFSVLEEMLKTNKDYQDILGYKRKHYLEKMKDDPDYVWGFTNMLFYAHQKQAEALAAVLDLRKYENVLDVAGGSGVMSIGLVRKFKHLKATVLDIEPVIKCTKKILKREGFIKQITTLAGDASKALPDGYDVIMFCDSGILDENTLKKAYDKLPPKGLLVIVDYLSSEDLTEPYNRLMWQMRTQDYMLVTRKHAAGLVKKSGFKNVKLKRLFKDSWLITGVKP